LLSLGATLSLNRKFLTALCPKASQLAARLVFISLARPEPLFLNSPARQIAHQQAAPIGWQLNEEPLSMVSMLGSDNNNHHVTSKSCSAKQP